MDIEVPINKPLREIVRETPRVVLESPYAGDVQLNRLYARACLLDSLMRGEAPIASHLLHPQVLDDHDENMRRAGMIAGWAWLPALNRDLHNLSDKHVFYLDLGWSTGMKMAREVASQLGLQHTYEERRLDDMRWRQWVESLQEGGLSEVAERAMDRRAVANGKK